MTSQIWLLLLLGLFAACVPQTKQTDCASGEAFNSALRKCVLITGSAASTIHISSASPAQSYTTNISSASVPHNVTVSDSYNYGYIVKWKVSFTYNLTVVNNITLATNVSSYTFNPNVLYGVGSYVLEAIVFDSTGASQISVKSWNITVSNLAVPELISPSPAGTAMSYTTATTSATHTLFINNPDSQSGTHIWRLDGVIVAGPVAFTGVTVFFNYILNPSLLALGIHTLSLEINNGLASVFDTYLWTIIVTSPNLPEIIATTPNYLNGVSVVNGITQALGGYLDMTNTPIPQFCVDVDNYDLDANLISDIDIKWEINGISVNVGTFSSNQYCINALPAINLVNPTIGESKDLKALVYKAGTTTLVDYRNWSLSVRPKNIRPQITIDNALTAGALGCDPVGAGSTNVNYANCAMTQSTVAFPNPMNFAFEIDDPDIGDPILNDTQYSVLFKLQNMDLDGVSNTYSATDCSYTLANAFGSAKMSCNLSMDAFNIAGTIPAGTYTLKAYIVDNGSPWTLVSEQSNEVSWTIAVSELQTANSIAISSQTNIVSPTLSYIRRSTSGCIDTLNVLSSVTSFPNNATENGYVLIHTFVRDEERDNFSITIDMANGDPAFPGSFITVVPTSVKVNALPSVEYYEVVSCVQIPEWAVWNQASSIVDLKVSVTDAPTNILLTQYSDTETFQIFVENNNPAPAFTIATTPVVLNVKVFAGFPFTIPAPAYTDASIFDGVDVEFKWRVSVDGGVIFTDIPNADSVNQASAQLVWTPSPFIADGTPIQLQLCLGDDGYGAANDVATCTVNKVYNTITAYPSVQQLAATDFSVPATFKTYSSGNDLASWYDATEEKLYVAYTAGLEIIVEKKQFGANGELETVHSISFDSEEPNKVSVAPSNLSITGIDSKSLLIAYSVPVNPTSFPQMRVRRIALENDKFGFHYVGLYNPLYAGLGSDLVTNSLTNTTIAAFGNDSMTLNFTGMPLIGETIMLNGVTFTYAGNAGGHAVHTFCTGAAPCATPAAVAAAFNDVLNDNETLLDPVTDVAVREVLYTDYTALASSIDIYGPSSGDYYDEINKTTPVVGQIMAKGAGTNQWYLPYANLTTSLALAVMHGTSADTDLSNSINSHTPVSSSTFNQSIANTIDTAGLFVVVTKNSSGNADVYKLNTGTFTVASSITSLFNLSGFDHVSNLSVSVGASNYIYTAGTSVTAGGATHLNAAIIDSANFTNKTVQPFFTLSNTLVTDVDQVKIVADPVNVGQATLAITTDATLEARLGRITFNNASWANPIAFYNYESPKLNDDATVSGGKISLTPIFSLTKGHASGLPSVANTKDTVFFSFHENDSGNNIIKAGMLNVTPATITTDDASVIGSYPANLK